MWRQPPRLSAKRRPVERTLLSVASNVDVHSGRLCGRTYEKALLESRFEARHGAHELVLVLAYDGVLVIDPVGVGFKGLGVVKLVVLVPPRIALCAKCTVHQATGAIPPESDVALVVYEGGFGTDSAGTSIVVYVLAL